MMTNDCIISWFSSLVKCGSIVLIKKYLCKGWLKVLLCQIN